MNPRFRPLKLIHAESAASLAARQTQIGVGFGSTQSECIVQFEVESAQESHVNPEFAHDEPQWELWNWDVVEVFIQEPKGPRYFEFQISPLGQFFEMEIIEPRKRLNKDFRSRLRVHAKRTGPGNWTATFRIPWLALGGARDPGSEVRGGAFSILGQKGAKTYWALHLGPQTTPDFHLPDYFRGLFTTGMI